MARRILQILSHSVEEHDMLRLHHQNGNSVASLGGYIDPAYPHVDIRPALPEVPLVSVVKDAVDALEAVDNIQAAKERIPDAILDWADTIIQHHYLASLYNQWPRIRAWLKGDSNRRVIWRTVGQSVDGNEHDAAPFRAEGMEIVRYSPKERNIPLYAGEDTLIRFGKDPDEWAGWSGELAAVGNVTQKLSGRDPWTHYAFFRDATVGLPTLPAGPGSEEIGGLGELSYDAMREYLRRIRVYLYTGTQPASYTLGLIEAMMTGVPIVSMGAGGFRQPIFPYVPAMFEGAEIVGRSANDASEANAILGRLLTDESRVAASVAGRERAIELFGIDRIRAEWAQYLA